MVEDSVHNLRQVLQVKIHARLLPDGHSGAVAVAAGHLQRRPCDACDLETDVGTAEEYDVTLADGRIFRFHAPCLNMWDEEMRSPQPAASPAASMPTPPDAP